jgi:hypothetical protein
LISVGVASQRFFLQDRAICKRQATGDDRTFHESIAAPLFHTQL